MPLSDSKARQAKPKEKAYRIADEKGMYLEVTPKGGKYWRMKYRFGGKEKRLAIGVYPEITLKMARVIRDEARRQLLDGLDPSTHKQTQKLLQATAHQNSFEAVGVEWFAKQKPQWAENHWTKVERMMTADLFPYLGKRPASEITPPELLATLRKIEARGALESAKRTKQIAGQIFRYAVATGRADRDPSQDLKGALATPVKKHFSAITDPKDVGPLLNALDGYQGTAVVRAALKLAPLTFVRPGELRTAKWEDIDFEKAEWRYFITKTKTDHIVPLSKQAMEILEELQPLTSRSIYIFPSARSAHRPMSNNAVLSAMRRMGIGKDEMCGHGFRTMARTILDEEFDMRPDWLEQQLAHALKDTHGRAYNRTAHLKQRKKMMQVWADYLDDLKARCHGGNVVNIR